MRLKIVATSDLHGHLPQIEDPADICILVGDLVPLNIQRNMPESKIWFETIFADWIEQLPVDQVFMVAGNHDFYFENITEDNLSSFRIACKGKLTYLHNEMRNYIDSNGLQWSIFGTPYCHEFGRWAFERSEYELIKFFKKIPEKLDILITHDPPFGITDVDCIMVPIYSSQLNLGHIGNKVLAKQILNLKEGPTIVFSGHIHSADHNIVVQNNISYVGVSLLDERYNETYSPLYTTIIPK